MPFYRFKLRGFLKENLGRAVWLKGEFTGDEEIAPAYLIFYDSLMDRVIELLSEPLEDMGFYEMSYADDPMKIILKYVRREKLAVGYLKLPSGLSLGSPETIREEPLSPREKGLVKHALRGFYLDSEFWGRCFFKAEKAEVKVSNGEEWLIMENVTIRHQNGATVNEPKYALRVSQLCAGNSEIKKFIIAYTSCFGSIKCPEGIACPVEEDCGKAFERRLKN